jgi:hypothetical protein
MLALSDCGFLSRFAGRLKQGLKTWVMVYGKVGRHLPRDSSEVLSMHFLIVNSYLDLPGD